MLIHLPALELWLVGCLLFLLLIDIPIYVYTYIVQVNSNNKESCRDDDDNVMLGILAIRLTSIITIAELSHNDFLQLKGC